MALSARWRLLDRVPEGAAVAIMLRHAERQEIAPGAFGNDVHLTRRGRQSARRLGEGLSSRRPGIVKSSPLPRCTQTADAIIAGAGWKASAAPERLLGDPGPFVVEPELVGRLFLDIGIEEIVRRQLADDEPPRGMRSNGIRRETGPARTGGGSERSDQRQCLRHPRRRAGGAGGPPVQPAGPELLLARLPGRPGGVAGFRSAALPLAWPRRGFAPNRRLAAPPRWQTPGARSPASAWSSRC